MNKMENLVTVIKEDVNAENSEIVYLFEKLLNKLFSFILFIGVPYILYLLFL